MAEKKQMSREGYEKLEQELNYLITVRRAEVAQKLKEARSFGDLSENAEYDAAKEAQGLLELKIANLRNLISKARVLDESKIDVTKVLIYSIVTVKNVKTGAVMTYTIVPESESDFKAGKISVTSPLAKSLIGNTKGDVVTMQAPAGAMDFEILEVSR